MLNYSRAPRQVLVAAILTVAMLGLISACGGETETQFVVKHLREQPGEQLTETISYQDYQGLDNSTGNAAMQVQIDLKRTYTHQINARLSTDTISSQRVEQKIVELYKLPAEDPEREKQTALCPLSVVIPAGHKASVTVEWTERWAEGVVNEGIQGQGDQLGTFDVFLGYIEPCSLVGQENVK